MSLSALLRDLPVDVDLRAQTELGCPPQFLTIEGVRRTRGRALASAEAVTHAKRGRPAYVLTFGKCSQVPPELLAAVLDDEDFQFSARCDEADIRMYGQRHPGEPDTRLVVATIALRVE
ncbi:hypothetical protein NUM3379_36100 [Kineococcus sp. NUM-3379]